MEYPLNIVYPLFYHIFRGSEQFLILGRLENVKRGWNKSRQPLNWNYNFTTYFSSEDSMAESSSITVSSLVSVFSKLGAGVITFMIERLKSKVKKTPSASKTIRLFSLSTSSTIAIKPPIVSTSAPLARPEKRSS